MKYLLVIEETGSGFSAYSPDPDGCVATGSTREEVEEQMREAVAVHLEGMREGGYDAPSPRSYSTYLDIPA